MGPEGGCAVSHVFLNAWGFESPDFVKWAMCISQTAVFGVSGPSFRKSNFSVLNSPIFSFRRKNTALSCGVFAVYLFCQHILELLGRFELPTSSLPSVVEPSSPCCIRLFGVFCPKRMRPQPVCSIVSIRTFPRVGHGVGQAETSASKKPRTGFIVIFRFAVSLS